MQFKNIEYNHEGIKDLFAFPVAYKLFHNDHETIKQISDVSVESKFILITLK